VIRNYSGKGFCFEGAYLEELLGEIGDSQGDKHARHPSEFVELSVKTVHSAVYFYSCSPMTKSLRWRAGSKICSPTRNWRVIGLNRLFF